MTEVHYSALSARFALGGQTLDDSRARRPALSDISDVGQAQLVEWADYQREMIADVERPLPDVDLCAAYPGVSGGPGALEADTLLAEIKRRGSKV